MKKKEKLTKRERAIVFVATMKHLNSQRLEDFGSEYHYEKHKREIERVVDFARDQS